MATGAVVAAPLRWDLLETSPPTGQRLLTRVALPDSSQEVLIAMDAAKLRYVLVRIPDGEVDQVNERASRGIAVSTVEGSFGSATVEKFVQVACLEVSGHFSLDGVACELAEALAGGASIGVVRLVTNVLAKWRRFWGTVNQGVMSKEEQIGLFGELWFFHHWLTPAVGPSQAAHIWRGPVKARNDFESPKFAVEVKTSSKVQPTYAINGLEQLLEPLDGILLLFALSVREEASGTESLPRLVQQIKHALSEDFGSLAKFESILYASKFEDDHVAEYAKLSFRVREQFLYRVGPTFPRLIPSSIVGSVPPEVVSLTYELRLDGSTPGLLSVSPLSGAPLIAEFIS